MLVIIRCEICGDSEFKYGLIENKGFDYCKKCNHTKSHDKKIQFCSKKCLLEYIKTNLKYLNL